MKIELEISDAEVKAFEEIKKYSNLEDLTLDEYVQQLVRFTIAREHWFMKRSREKFGDDERDT